MFSVMQEEIPNQDEVSNEVTKDSLIADSPEGKRENTRSKIATIYVYAFLQQLLLLLLLD